MAGHHLNMELLGRVETGRRVDGQKVAYLVEKSDGVTTVTEDLFNPPAPTLTDKLGGKAELRVRLLPDNELALRDFRLSGTVAYTVGYNAKQGLPLNGKATAKGLTGSRYEGDQPDALVEGMVSLGAEVALGTPAEIEVYRLAIPESLRPTF